MLSVDSDNRVDAVKRRGARAAHGDPSGRHLLDNGPLGAATSPGMDNTIPVEQEMLEHARRQTKALEGIHGLLMFFLALSILGVLVALAQIFGS